MIPGLILNALAFAAAGGNIALHYPKIIGNRASLKPRREQAVMVLALLLVAVGFSSIPAWSNRARRARNPSGGHVPAGLDQELA